MRLASCAARELRVYSFCFVCSGGGAGLKSAPGAQGLDSSKGPPEFHFLEPVLIPDSATRHWQPQILLRARRRPASLTSSCRTWSPPMCAHHRCSRRESVRRTSRIYEVSKNRHQAPGTWQKGARLGALAGIVCLLHSDP